MGRKNDAENGTRKGRRIRPRIDQYIHLDMLEKLRDGWRWQKKGVLIPSKFNKHQTI